MAKTFHIGVIGMSGTATAGSKPLSAFFMFEYGAGGNITEPYTTYYTNRKDFFVSI